MTARLKAGVMGWMLVQPVICSDIRASMMSLVNVCEISPEQLFRKPLRLTVGCEEGAPVG